MLNGTVVGSEYETMGTVDEGHLRGAGDGFEADWYAVEQELWTFSK